VLALCHAGQSGVWGRGCHEPPCTPPCCLLHQLRLQPGPTAAPEPIAITLPAQLIDLGAAADLRTGTNYRPDESILDPTYAAPEQARAGLTDGQGGVWRCGWLGFTKGCEGNARACVRRAWPCLHALVPRAGARALLRRSRRARARHSAARGAGRGCHARSDAASPRLSGRPARSTACRRTRRTWRATRHRWRWPCRRCCGAATSRTCSTRTLPARQAAQPHPVGFKYTLYVYPTCILYMYIWGPMLLRPRQPDPAGLFASAWPARRFAADHAMDARMQTGWACPVGARMRSHAQAHNGGRCCCPARFM